MGQHAVTVVADAASADALAPLLDHWRHGPGLRLLPWGSLAGGDPQALAALADGASAVLVVGTRQRSPRTVLPAPVLTAPDGTVVPAAWLPATSAADLGRFARTAVAVHARAATASADAGQPASGADPHRTLVVLGERHPRFDRLAERIVRIGGETDDGVQVRRATAYELSRDDLADLLATGPALGVYVGHGRPIGWVGYAGTRAHHLASAVDRLGPPARGRRRVAHLPDGQPPTHRALVRRGASVAWGRRRHARRGHLDRAHRQRPLGAAHRPRRRHRRAPSATSSRWSPPTTRTPPPTGSSATPPPPSSTHPQPRWRTIPIPSRRHHEPLGDPVRHP